MTNEDDIDPKVAEAKKAQDLIRRGHLEDADEREILSEVQLTEAYFRKIDTYHLERLLIDFERHEFTETRQAAGQVLAAYFDWCFRTRRKVVPRSSEGFGLWAYTIFATESRGNAEWEHIDSYLARYAQITVTRMVGAYNGVLYQREFNRLPSWVRPDAVFGLVRPRGRPKGSDMTRDMAIYAHVELLWRKGVLITIAKQRAAQKFRCSASKVEKTLKKLDEGGHVVLRSGELKRPYELTDDELEAMLDGKLKGI